MHRPLLRAAAGAAIGLLSGAAATAALAPQATAPAAPSQPTRPAATAPAGGGAAVELTGVVTDVRGMAEIRDDDHSEWRPCEKGAVVREHSEIRTGPHTTVEFAMPQGQVVAVARLTVLQVIRSEQDNKLVLFDLGLKYGRTRYEIESAGVEYRSTIRSPNSTLAVRGTIVSVYDQGPFPPRAVSFTGRAVYTAGRKQVAFGGKNAGRQEVRPGQEAASVALDKAVQDPVTPFARTAQEVPLVTNLLASGAVLSFPPGSRIPVASGGVPPTDQQLVSLLPGTLNFVLRWTGNADLNLVVGNQAGAGEALVPASGLNSTPSGGRIPFNHVGGPSGGFEIAYWPRAFPTGMYAAAAQHVSGASTQFTINAFDHGQPLPIFNPAGNAGAGQFQNSVSGTSDPGSSVSVFVPVGVAVPPGFGTAGSARRPAASNGRPR